MRGYVHPCHPLGGVSGMGALDIARESLSMWHPICSPPGMAVGSRVHEVRSGENVSDRVERRTSSYEDMDRRSRTAGGLESLPHPASKPLRAYSNILNTTPVDHAAN